MLSVSISSPEKRIWQGEAEWVSAVNSAGPFDILPFHANFISIVEKQTIKIRTKDQIEEFFFEYCVIYVNKDTVRIFANTEPVSKQYSSFPSPSSGAAPQPNPSPAVSR